MEHSVFGCKVNKFYLNKWLGYFRQRQFDPVDGHLMATCVVTDRAKSKRVRATRMKLQQGKQLFLTGCGAFEKGEAMDYEQFFRLYPELVGWKEQITLLGEDPSVQTDLGHIGSYELNTEYDEQELHQLTRKQLGTKKFIVIQSGCDTFCTFCLTIYKRGSQRNRPLPEIIDEIRGFVDAGGKEIVITGVNLASRGASHTRKPAENQFSELLETILRETTIPRIRISSLGPEFLDDRFFELMSDTRFLPHFHVSIQHFDDAVLRRMNRNYDSKVLDRILTGLRSLQRPDRELISIGADLIVGFPGETEEAFQWMVDAVEEYQITKLHAFPFSAHQKGETVPAGKLTGQIPTATKQARMEQLMLVGDRVRADFVSANRGVSHLVLIEKKEGKRWFGRTPNYLEAWIDDTGYQRGDLVSYVLV